MAAKAIQELRLLLGQTAPKQAQALLAVPGVDWGLPQGALTNLSGHGKSEWVVRLLESHSGLRAAWVETDCSLFPTALLVRSIGSERVVYVRAGEDFFWTLRQLIKSQLFPVLVARGTDYPETELRRLQIAAKRAGTTLLILSDSILHAWPLALQVRVARRSFVDLEAQVLRRKFEVER